MTTNAATANRLTSEPVDLSGVDLAFADLDGGAVETAPATDDMPVQRLGICKTTKLITAPTLANPDNWPAPELFNPATGEVVSATDADALIDAFEQVKLMHEELSEAKRNIAHAIAKLTEGEKKTRRVRGKRRRAKVEMPGTDFDQSVLKEAWHAFPERRDEVLKVATITVKLREWKKVKGETGPDDFETFKRMIAMSERPSRATPSITIED
jgi:hypothetical protein